MKTYYRCLIRFRQRDRYALWYTNDVDGFVLRRGKIPVFGSEEELERFAGQQEVVLEPEEPEVHHLDLAAQWVQTGVGAGVNCSVFNSVFNLCLDAAAALGQPASWERPEFNRIYDKLFWGCNLPAVTPPGREYVPLWSLEELAILRDVLRKALDQFLAGAEFVPDP